MNTYIFDFGANIGQNLEYFLAKADIVVAIEANPALCEEIVYKFPKQISSGSLVVVNLAVCSSTDAYDQDLTFYVHRTRSVLSSLIKPPDHEMHNYQALKIKASTPGEIIRNFIGPQDRIEYIKIDLEGYDSFNLNSLETDGVLFNHLSIEAHNITSLISALNYKGITGFRLFDQKDVSQKYSNARIKTKEGSLVTHSFQDHSSGPFGEDLIGDYYSKADFLEYFLISEGGWKDIHITSISNVLCKPLPLKFIVFSGLKRYFKVIYRNRISETRRSGIYRFRRKFLMYR